MLYPKQVVAGWLFKKFFAAEKDRLRRNSAFGNKKYVGTDTFRKDIVQARYAACKKTVDTGELIDKPINTILALMITKPRRFVYKAEELERKEYRQKHRDTLLRASRTETRWRITVTDRVTKAAFSYSYTYTTSTTGYGSQCTDISRITGCTKDEAHWMAKAFSELGKARGTRVRKAKAYLEDRKLRETRNALLELYPEGE